MLCHFVMMGILAVLMSWPWLCSSKGPIITLSLRQIPETLRCDVDVCFSETYIKWWDDNTRQSWAAERRCNGRRKPLLQPARWKMAEHILGRWPAGEFRIFGLRHIRILQCSIRTNRRIAGCCRYAMADAWSPGSWKGVRYVRMNSTIRKGISWRNTGRLLRISWPALSGRLVRRI